MDRKQSRAYLGAGGWGNSGSLAGLHHGAPEGRMGLVSWRCRHQEQPVTWEQAGMNTQFQAGFLCTPRTQHLLH